MFGSVGSFLDRLSILVGILATAKSQELSARLEVKSAAVAAQTVRCAAGGGVELLES